MAAYSAPLRDMRFVLYELFGVQRYFETLFPGSGISEELIDSVLAEAARLAETRLAPLNQSGDLEGCHLRDGAVVTPQGFKDAFELVADGGWCGLEGPEQYGGSDLPGFVGMLVNEIFASANLSFSDYVGLITSASKLIYASAPDDLKQVYLPKLLAGEWAATMCMTEPHCGTDVGLLRTKAVADGEGSYRITGTKIFISGGDHDLTTNIAHLVLARLPDAPDGVKGVSLFLAPKFIPDAAGELGERNAVTPVSLEHKMGYTASATCQLEFAGARGWLLGEPNKGLKQMFVMVNEARLYVAQQGLSTSEAAYQCAAQYARERLQGRALTGAQNPGAPADPIIAHPDVRRMLLQSKAFNEGARALIVWAALQQDICNHHPDAQARQVAGDYLALLTPVLKATLTDLGFDSCNNSVQIHGGHGYIKDLGVEQFVRDARIAQIQEGANGIQALDLVCRKLPMHDGRLVKSYFHALQTFCDENEETAGMDEFVEPLRSAYQILREATLWLQDAGNANPNEFGAAGVDYQRIFGLTALAWTWAQTVKVCLEKRANGPENEFHDSKIRTARYYMNWMLPMIRGHYAVMRGGADSMMDVPAEYFYT